MWLWTCPQCEKVLTSDRRHSLPVSCSKKCGFKDHTGEHITEISADQAKTLGIVEVGRFIGETLAWKLKGSPKRSDEEVERILTTICAKCELFVDGVCTHPRCGCTLTTKAGQGHKISRVLVNIGELTGVSNAFFEKVRRATSHCPIKLW